MVPYASVGRISVVYVFSATPVPCLGVEKARFDRKSQKNDNFQPSRNAVFLKILINVFTILYAILNDS
jgi:hypothetical protein